MRFCSSREKPSFSFFPWRPFPFLSLYLVAIRWRLQRLVIAEFVRESALCAPPSFDWSEIDFCSPPSRHQQKKTKYSCGGGWWIVFPKRKKRGFFDRSCSRSDVVITKEKEEVEITFAWQVVIFDWCCRYIRWTWDEHEMRWTWDEQGQGRGRGESGGKRW